MSENMASGKGDVLHFGSFGFELGACRLARDGVEVHLTPKAAAVLCLLLQRPGELIGKDEFLETVWEGVHVREESLTQAISVIRQALGDSAQSPQFIQTVSGEGYRFIGELSEIEPGDLGTGYLGPGDRDRMLQRASVEAERAFPRWSQEALWKAAISTIIILGAIALVAALWSPAVAPDQPGALPEDRPSEISPLTADGGQKGNARLSPDGKFIAFDWRAEGAESRDIWVEPVAPGADYIQVTGHAAEERGPAWSTDGSELAFLRIVDGRAAVYKVPFPGGDEERLFDIEGPASVAGGFNPTLTWSADGRYMALGERPVADQPSRIVLVDLAAEPLRKTVLTSPPAEAGAAGDVFPAFHPDSRQIVFARGQGVWGNWDLWVVDVDGGDAKPVTHEGYTWLYNPVWSQDGEEVLFQAGPYNRNLSTFRVRLDGGPPRYVEGLGSNDRVGNVARGRMVFRRITRDPQDVWAAPLRSGDAAMSSEIVESIHDDLPTSFDPEGRLTFESDRSGSYQAWLMRDGLAPRQLTDAETDANFTRWSPDGRYIAFDSNDSGNRDIWIQEADSPASKRNLTDHPATEMWPTFSRDSRYVYFNSNRDGASQIWKVPVEGGEAVRVTQGGGAWGMESGDGYFYYAKNHGQTGIWRMPVGGGEESPVIAGPLDWAAWDIGPSGIYWAPGPGTSEEFTVRYQAFGTRQSRVVYREEGIFARAWLRVSPDETMVVFGKNRPSTSELFLVENFR